MPHTRGYFLLEVVIAMAILTLVVNNLMTSLQGAQATIHDINRKQLALIQCESVLEYIRHRCRLEPKVADWLDLGGELVEFSPTMAPITDQRSNALKIAYRAYLRGVTDEAVASPPVIIATPSEELKAVDDLLSVEVFACLDVSSAETIASTTIARLWGLFAAEQ